MADGAGATDDEGGTETRVGFEAVAAAEAFIKRANLAEENPILRLVLGAQTSAEATCVFARP
jgi:hypothetical protein